MILPDDTLYEQAALANTFECDVNRNWKPAAFFQHLTAAATLHATKLGVGYEAMYAQNLYWVHSRMKIQFIRFPQVEERILIRTWPKTIQQKLFYIRDFEVLDDSGERLATATSAWLIINAATRRLIPPQTVAFDLPALSDRAGLDEPLERLNLAQNGEERLRMRAGYSSVDLLGHVNNSRYVDWICDAFPLEMYRRRIIAWMQVNYDHEILPGEEVAILANPLGGDDRVWAVEGLNRSNGTRAFEAALGWRDRPMEG